MRIKKIEKKRQDLKSEQVLTGTNFNHILYIQVEVVGGQQIITVYVCLNRSSFNQRGSRFIR
jgi:hypothetical protein